LGITPPASTEAKSLRPIIKNQETRVRDNIYNVYGPWSRSIKTPDGFTLIAYNVNGTRHLQLFDLQNDPWETNNLSEDAVYKERIQNMWKLLKEEMSNAHDDLDIDLPDWGRGPNQKGAGS